MIEIVPSILAADVLRLGEQVEAAFAAGVHTIHCDVMDGQFVPSISFGAQLVEALRPLADRYQATLEAHLMVADPQPHLSPLVTAGANVLLVHVEATAHLHDVVRFIRERGARPGVALSPGTPISALEEILGEIDQVLVMSVDPGCGGKPFLPSSLDKVARLRGLLQERDLSQVAIGVDGGVTADTAARAVRAGASRLVVGSALYNSLDSVAANLAALRAAVHTQVNKSAYQGQA